MTKPIKYIVPFCDTHKLIKTGNFVAPPDLCTPEETTDPYLSNVKLLMGFEGPHGSTGAPGMLDESPSHHGLPAVFGTAQVNTAEAAFGSSSLWLNGAGDRLNFPDSDDFNLSDRKWTIELYVYPLILAGATYNTRLLIGQWDKFYDLGWVVHTIGDSIAFTVNDGYYGNSPTGGYGTILQSPFGAIALNRWDAIALDFDGITYRLYMNGITVASHTPSRVIHNSSWPLTIGANGDGIFGYGGFIDEIRLTVGVARYANNTCYHIKTTPFQRPS